MRRLILVRKSRIYPNVDEHQLVKGAFLVHPSDTWMEWCQEDEMTKRKNIPVYVNKGLSCTDHWWCASTISRLSVCISEKCRHNKAATHQFHESKVCRRAHVNSWQRNLEYTINVLLHSSAHFSHDQKVNLGICCCRSDRQTQLSGRNMTINEWNTCYTLADRGRTSCSKPCFQRSGEHHNIWRE